MGRARSGQMQAAAVARAGAGGGFEAVLGARRGSAAAQAQRDLAERAGAAAQVETELEDFQVTVSASTGPDGNFFAELLVRAFRQGIPRAEAAAAILERIEGDVVFGLPEKFQEMTTVLEFGDPPLCPGLTAPMQQAFCDYFAADSVEDSRRLHGEQLIRQLFGVGYTVEHYQRLAPLCAALAPLLRDQMDGGSRFGWELALALENAPEGALAGPLRPWINEFALRIKLKLISDPERQELQVVLLKHPPGSVGARALAKIVEQL